MIRRFLSLAQAERDAIYEQESSNTSAQQHCTDRLTMLSNDTALVRLQKQDCHYAQVVALNLRQSSSSLFGKFILKCNIHLKDNSMLIEL